MFLGEFQHTLDAKGRVSLPRKFRNELEGHRLVVVKGFEGCLHVYAVERYEEFVGRLMGRDDFDPKFRKVRRFFTSGAVDVEIDGAGRVMLSSALRDFAGLSREVSVNGNGDRIEIWDAERFSAYNGDTTEHIEDAAKELAELGLL
ncbi:MAG: division/cell wall cluster transcriptional repressor MraZ [Coriobacteriia bacterium]